MKRIELQNIRNGVVFDLFDEEFKKVLANIGDENTVASAERSITIKISIKPDKTRRTGAVKIQSSATLAKIEPKDSLVFFDHDQDGQFIALADDPAPELPGLSEDSNITTFPKASGGK